MAETLNPVLQGGAASTADDDLRFLSMLAQGGVFEARRVLPDAHYSLGSWCETWDTQGACLRNSSIGYFGVYPWVERQTGRFGIVFPYVRDNAFRFWPEIERMRDAVVR